MAKNQDEWWKLRREGDRQPNPHYNPKHFRKDRNAEPQTTTPDSNPPKDDKLTPSPVGHVIIWSAILTAVYVAVKYLTR